MNRSEGRQHTLRGALASLLRKAIYAAGAPPARPNPAPNVQGCPGAPGRHNFGDWVIDTTVIAE